VSSVRDRKPVFVKIFRTWLSTVRSDRTSFLATSLFESACATSSATSRSRAVNGSGILEVIAPAGLEELFRRLAGGEYDPETLPALAGQYGGEIDFDRTMPLVERHGLVF
jgi:hypothetical protein